MKTPRIRKFEPGCSGDPAKLLDWLERECGRKTARRSLSRAHGKIFEVDGKRYDHHGLLKIVNAERTKRNLEPLQLPKKAA